MGRLTFGETIYLLLMGEVPVAGIGSLMEAILVSFIDHGATPPSTLAARNTATTGAPLRACVAAGVLGFGRFHGGDIESCMQFLDAGLELVRGGRHLQATRRSRIVQQCFESERADPRLRPPLPHARPPGRPTVPDGARARGGGRSHPDDPRRRAGDRRAARRPRTCRSTSTARLPRSAATSASRPPSPTRCSSSRACPASRRRRTKSATANTRCGRSIRRITCTTAPASAVCRTNAGSRLAAAHHTG